MKKIVSILSLILMLAMFACEDEVANTGPEDGGEDPVDTVEVWPGENYIIPDYADDYSSISSWANRAQWNLANVHDPSVVYDGEYYYMYGTDASYGNVHDGHGHFPYRRSKDLVNWEFRGMAMLSTPSWVKDSLNNIRASKGLDPIDNPIYGYWAPVVRKVGSKYRMYYSIIIDNYIGNGLSNVADNFDNTWTEHAFIGMMETSSLKNNLWADRGMVVHSTSDKGNNWYRASYGGDWGNAYFYFNAIDPTYQVTPGGKHYLIYGSWHSGIAKVEVDPETGKPYEYSGVTDKTQRIASRHSTYRWQGSEGPEIMYNAETGFYYLFLAYDGLSVDYNTRVCRSTSINGPFYGIDGANVTAGATCLPVVTHPYKFNDHSGWVGFAHNAVFQNEETGDWFYSSQARLPENTNGNAYSNAIMMGHVRKIRWTESGWPVVMPERYTAVPDKDITEDELVGKWENITLNYDAGVQQTSVELVLNEDNTATGAISGSWSYNSATKVLTIGSTQLCIEREVDWEASPRKLTIVYAGLSGNGITLWGKKVE